MTVSHMKDFAHGKNEYDGWDEGKRRQYIQDCAAIIKIRVLAGHVEGVPLRDYDDASKGEGPFGSSAFLFAAVGTMHQLNAWRRENMPNEQIAHIFEHGDGHEGEIRKMDELVRSGQDFRDLTGMVSFTTMGKSDSRGHPLQAADMLAYEGHKYLRDTEFETENPRKLRGSFKALLDTGKITSRYSDASSLHDLTEFSKKLSSSFSVMTTLTKTGQRYFKLNVVYD